MGGRGRTWAKTLVEHDQFSIEGLLDIDRPVLERTGAELGIPSDYRYTDYQKALSSGKFDSKATFTGYSGLWRFSCEKGDILANKEGCILYETEKGEEQVFVPDPEARSGDSILLDTVHEAITQGRPAPTCGADNLKTLELLFQIDSSS